MRQCLSARLILIAVLAGLAGPAPRSRAGQKEAPVMTAPPESFFAKVREKDREAALKFYKKYLDVKGMPVVASGQVADLALDRTYDLVTHLLAGRPDVLRAMVSNGMTGSRSCRKTVSSH